MRLVGLTLGAAVVLAGIAYWPMASSSGWAGVSAMLAGVGIAAAAALAGLVPVVRSLTKSPVERHAAMLVAMGVRFAVVLLLTVAAVFSGYFARVPLVAWVAGSYLLLLMVDTTATVAVLKGLEARRE